MVKTAAALAGTSETIQPRSTFSFFRPRRPSAKNLWGLRSFLRFLSFSFLLLPPLRIVHWLTRVSSRVCWLFYGYNGACIRPVVSGIFAHRLKFWIAWPAAPLPKLSITATTVNTWVSGLKHMPMSQKFVPVTCRSSGSFLTVALGQTDGLDTFLRTAHRCPLAKSRL